MIHSTGSTKAAPFALVEVKHLDRLKGGDSASAATQDAGNAGADSDARKWQDRWTIKITWDGRQVAVDRHQVEVMVLLIPRGIEGQHYCQSCLRIRTVMVLVGKDSQANVQANFSEMLSQAKEIVKNGVRYSAEKQTFMGQVLILVTHAPARSYWYADARSRAHSLTPAPARPRPRAHRLRLPRAWMARSRL